MSSTAASQQQQGGQVPTTRQAAARIAAQRRAAAAQGQQFAPEAVPAHVRQQSAAEAILAGTTAQPTEFPSHGSKEQQHAMALAAWEGQGQVGGQPAPSAAAGVIPGQQQMPPPPGQQFQQMPPQMSPQYPPPGYHNPYMGGAGQAAAQAGESGAPPAWGIRDPRTGQSLPLTALEADSAVGGISNPASGSSPATNNCPEGQFMDSEGNCADPAGAGTTSPHIPPKVDGPGGVKKFTEADEDSDSDSGDDDSDSGDDDSEKKGDEASLRNKALQVVLQRHAGENIGGPNADFRTIQKESVEAFEAMLKRQQARENQSKIARLEQANRMRRAALERMQLESALQYQISLAQPQALVPGGATGGVRPSQRPVAGAYPGMNPVQALKANATKMAEWFVARESGRDVPMRYHYIIDKQDFFERWPHRRLHNLYANGAEEWMPVPANMISGTGTGILPPSSDHMRVMSEQVFVDPNSKVVTPVRQFCETQVLPPDTSPVDNEFYGALVPPPAKMYPELRGVKCPISCSQIEENPVYILTMLNEAYAVGSVFDENHVVLNKTYNNDSAVTYGQTKPVGGGPKIGHWVDGSTGSQITNDASFTTDKKLRVAGLKVAKAVIQNAAPDTSNLVTYVPAQSMRDVIDDPNLDTYISFSMPEIITEATVERIAGTNLIRADVEGGVEHLAKLGGAAGINNIGYRCVMFVPNAAFQLTTGRDLVMSAQHRAEDAAVSLAGWHELAAAVKTVKATCRISCAA